MCNCVLLKLASHFAKPNNALINFDKPLESKSVKSNKFKLTNFIPSNHALEINQCSYPIAWTAVSMTILTALRRAWVRKPYLSYIQTFW